MFFDCAQVRVLVKQFGRMSLDSDLAELIIKAEDRRFRAHRGVDFWSLLRTAYNHIARRSKSGASTIEMQLVRTVTDRREVTLARKLREGLIAACVTAHCDKDEILTTYAMIAYFGENATGVKQAALLMFGREVNECTIVQKALIASALKRPIPVNRTVNWYRRIFKRARYLLADRCTT